jgi:hypothetical protein
LTAEAGFTAYRRVVWKDLITVLGITGSLVITMSVLAITFNVDVRILTGVSFLIFLWIIVLLYRRSRRSSPEVPSACHVAAAIALLVGASTLVGGVGHSVSVASLAWRDPQYGIWEILRLTTGAILVFSGAMTLAMCPGIRAGRGWAIGMSAAAGVLVWLHLLVVLPLPGTGGTVPPMLVLWSVHLLSLGAAAASLAVGKSKEMEVAR